ncbi:MAG: cysteine hydrolase [Lachnospiraceae bacterium]|nr:cysteine hydrolase [Lachnospiraceae bacterium]
MKEALIIIDVQNDYFPGGTCELHNPYEAEKVIQKLISESRSIGRPIVYIRHFNESGDFFFLEGTKGAEISDRIAPEPEDRVIIKRYPNSFLETELDAHLKSLGVDKLIVCGMMTHMCVDTTVRAAMDYGYEVDVVADACATMDIEYNGETIPADIVQKTFLASLEGVFATII